MMKKSLQCVSFIFLLALLPMVAIWAEETPEPINIFAVDDVKPFSFTLPNGRVTGLYVEFWELWSKSNNIPVNIILTPLEEAFQATKNKRGIYSGLFINDERKLWADFSIPIHSVQTGVLYNHRFPKTIKLSNTKGIKVAVQIASFQANYLIENFPKIELFFFDGLEKGINQLLNNDIDAIVAEIPTINARLAKLGLTGVFTFADEVLLTNTVHSAVGKGQPELLEQINQGIENIPLNELIALETKWLPTLKPFFKDLITFDALTMTEKKWLLRNTSFKLGIDKGWFPFDYLDVDGNYSGVSADYIDFANSTLDINIEPVNNESWSEALQALTNGDIDVISAIVKTTERSKILNFTEPYFIAPTVIVTRKSTSYVESIESLNHKKLGLIEGYSLYEFVKKDYPLIYIHSVSSVADGLKKLDAGEIDAFINTIGVINYEIDKQNISSLNIAGFSPYKFEISMAVRKGLEPLVTILNKTFSNMNEKQRIGIANTWLATRIQIGTETRTILLFVIPFFSILMVVIISIVWVNRRLKRDIAYKEQAERERAELESQLHQSQKMEALGKLTGGIAHDFNNMLAVIQGYSELLKNQVPKNSKLTDYINQILHAGERGTKLTKKLLSFTQTSSRDATNVDINKLVISQLDMLQKTLTVKINLEVELTEEVWPVWLDRNELEDALLNLCINAMHALSDKSTNALIRITTANQHLNASEAKSIGLSAGNFIQLCVIDTGRGMNETIKEKIFNPFFTTKGELGSGLGLSQVFGFVQRCGGRITVDTVLGEGSRFELYFPRHVDELEDTQSELEDNPAPGGSESILIVDDEVALSNLAFEMLVAQGYKVFTALSGNKALEIMAKERIDLLLSDVLMPEMDGYQLSGIVQERYPSIKIQLVSGFSENQNNNRIDNQLKDKLIYKPYKKRTLLKNIRILLDN